MTLGICFILTLFIIIIYISHRAFKKLDIRNASIVIMISQLSFIWFIYIINVRHEIKLIPKNDYYITKYSNKEEQPQSFEIKLNINDSIIFSKDINDMDLNYYNKINNWEFVLYYRESINIYGIHRNDEFKLVIR